jgi:hypothetical protein
VSVLARRLPDGRLEVQSGTETRLVANIDFSVPGTRDQLQALIKLAEEG